MRRSVAWAGLLLLVAAELQAQERPAKPSVQQLKAAQEAFAKLGAKYEAMTDPRTKETVHVFRMPRYTMHAGKGLPNPPFPFTLDLSGRRVTEAELKELKVYKNLTSLDLRETQVTSTGLKQLKDLKALATLILGGGVTDARLKALHEIGLLHALHRAKAKDGGRPSKTEEVHSLDLFNTRVTDAGLKELKDLKFVVTLNLSITQVTGAGLKELKGLATLDLSFTRVTDAGLKELKHLKALASLNLCETQVTDAGLKELKHLTALAKLGLAATQVTDAGLKELKDLKALVTLSLSGTQVTDAGLKELKHLKALTFLNLKGTKVTNAGLKELRKALPGCKIYPRGHSGKGGFFSVERHRPNLVRPGHGDDLPGVIP